ncbi:MAG: hypothetical protein AB1403_05645 [Candidatus Riflebacteria bacterium]
MVLILVFLAAFPALAEDYSFDVESFTPKRLEMDFRLDLRPGFSWFNAASRFYQLAYAEKEPRSFQQNHSVLAGTNGKYRLGSNSGFHFDGLLTISRFAGTTRDSHVLNESYVLFDVSPALQIGAGKRTFKWGKGYAWNPVNFAGRQKDLNDIDLALSGYSMLFSQFTRSGSGYLSNLTLTLAYLPVLHDLNDDFTVCESNNLVAQLYLLLGNTDVDLYMHLGESGNRRFGIDFSRNLAENHEIHAELVGALEQTDIGIRPGGAVVRDSARRNSLIVGTRYLDRNDVTYIFEYLHNGAGLEQEEMHSFYSAADQAVRLQNRPQMRQQAYNFSQFINRQFVMKDYLYFKASKPELFNHLYLNGSLFTLGNLADKSSSTTFEISYTGTTNQIVTLRYTANLGNRNSEFGQKLSSDRVELRCQYFF